MFNIGPWELILILVIVLIVFGPGRLPEVARSLGKAVNEFRRASTGVQRMWEEVIKENPAPAPQAAEQSASAQGGQAGEQRENPGAPEV
ncbi:MAG: Sec-independent protein translocase subunit TatA/TatB [Thermacetogeniaceae bacterium]